MIPVDPCGRAVDVVRACATYRVRPWRDSSDIGLIRTYRVAPGTEAIPFAHVWMLPEWQEDNFARDPVAGQVGLFSRGKYSKGEPFPCGLLKIGHGPCGSLRAWQGEGERALDPPLVWQPQGPSTCCRRMIGPGIAMRFRWRVKHWTTAVAGAIFFRTNCLVDLHRQNAPVNLALRMGMEFNWTRKLHLSRSLPLRMGMRFAWSKRFIRPRTMPFRMGMEFEWSRHCHHARSLSLRMGMRFDWSHAFTPGSGTITFDSPGDYTWTVPPGITSIDVATDGGGGGGSGADIGLGDGGGGGGGGYGETTQTVSPGDTINIHVGAGGSGGTGLAAGGNGEDSTAAVNGGSPFAIGGGGGGGVSGTGGGSGGSGTGDFSSSGGVGGLGGIYGDGGGGGGGGGGKFAGGGAGSPGSSSTGGSGGSAPSPGGNGGAGGNPGVDGSGGGTPGGGGGGGGGGGPDGSGGAGAAGQVVISW